MLSLDRKVWMEGPDLPMLASFNHANGIHSSPESGPNPKVKNHPESIWNMV